MGQTFDDERATVVRLRDIAEAVGVSVATVSLAVNHKDSGRVNPELATLIRDTARSMNYRPNINAVDLRLSKTHTVALLSQTVTDDPFLAAMTLGAQEAAWGRGYNLITVPEYGPSPSRLRLSADSTPWT